MNLIEALEWSNWKKLTVEAKKECFRLILMYFVNPLRELTAIELVDFSFGGLKCQTFELEIDGEAFVFIPGNSEAILGWDLGVQGLPTNAWDKRQPDDLSLRFQTFYHDYQLTNSQEWDEFVNLHTSPIRKAKIPPMLVQKYALPAGTTYLGMLDTITGEFTGDLAGFNPLEEKVREVFDRPQSLEDSLNWVLPTEYFKAGQFYLELADGSDSYYVFTHHQADQLTLEKAIRKKGFDLLTEDQWEYVVGAGTRRLFRWGNDLDNDDSYWGRAVKRQMKEPNMFGLVIACTLTRYELTKGRILKLDQWEHCGIPLLDFLPLATYYRSQRQLEPSEILSPKDFLYRKAVIIKLD